MNKFVKLLAVLLQFGTVIIRVVGCKRRKTPHPPRGSLDIDPCTYKGPIIEVIYPKPEMPK